MSMFMNKFFGMFAISAALCGGCSDPSNLDNDGTANLQQKGGGWNANGPDLIHGIIAKKLVQGIRLGREAPVPSTFMGETGNTLWTIDSTTFNGQQIDSLTTVDGFFRVSYSGGHIADRMDTAGLTFNFKTSLTGLKGTSVPFSLTVKEVADASPDSHSTSYGLHSMWYSYQDSRGETVSHSLCVNSKGEPEPAVPLRGKYWDTTTGNMIGDERVISFACQTAAVAGCMEYGYVPFDSHKECNHPTDPTICHDADMWNVLQTCTRVKRADYCGTGRSHTISGTEIWPADWLDPHVTNDARALRPSLEAIWNNAGVSCVIVENLRHKELLDDDVDCYNQLYNPAPGYNPHKMRCVWERPGTDILADLVMDPQ